MKPPPTATADGPLALLISAAKTGRLVALLRGEGLSECAVEELLRPESAATLRAVLAERLYASRDDHDPSAESQTARLQSAGGKVLAFKARESFES